MDCFNSNRFKSFYLIFVFRLFCGIRSHEYVVIASVCAQFFVDLVDVFLSFLLYSPCISFIFALFFLDVLFCVLCSHFFSILVYIRRFFLSFFTKLMMFQFKCWIRQKKLTLVALQYQIAQPITYEPTEHVCVQDIACGGKQKNVQRTEAACVLGKWADNVCWGNEYIEWMACRF